MGQKILVVEDNELNLKLFCDLLRAHAYTVEPVRDGREAVERARSFEPDLIVMDIQMPHISGLELIEQLKADAALKAIPIMAVTAYAARGDEERIRDAGAEGYVSKPISVVKFVEAVRALLALERKPAEAAAPDAEPEMAPEPDLAPVRVTRTFDSPCERLFDAWLDAETAGNWLFATPDGESVRVEIDPRVGGHFAIVDRRDGEDVLHSGTYEEIDRPRRLVFTLQVPKYSDEVSRVAIDFATGEQGCTLTLEGADAPPDEAVKYEQGWAMILDGLAAQLGEGTPDVGKGEERQ